MRNKTAPTSDYAGVVQGTEKLFLFFLGVWCENLLLPTTRTLPLLGSPLRLRSRRSSQCHLGSKSRVFRFEVGKCLLDFVIRHPRRPSIPLVCPPAMSAAGLLLIPGRSRSMRRTSRINRLAQPRDHHQGPRDDFRMTHSQGWTGCSWDDFCITSHL